MFGRLIRVEQCILNLYVFFSLLACIWEWSYWKLSYLEWAYCCIFQVVVGMLGCTIILYYCIGCLISYTSLSKQIDMSDVCTYLKYLYVSFKIWYAVTFVVFCQVLFYLIYHSSCVCFLPYYYGPFDCCWRIFGPNTTRYQTSYHPYEESTCMRWVV